MDGLLQDGVVYVGGNARQKFYDSGGYGRLARGDDPGLSGDPVALAPVEAAHLLYRGDLDAVEADGQRLDFRSFLARAGAIDGAESDGGSAFPVRFLVYTDLRERGFYLTPVRLRWPNVTGASDGDFLVYPRGSGPRDGDIEFRIRAVGERASLRVADLDGEVLAVVDEESDVSYFETERPEVSGAVDVDRAEGVATDLLADRAVAWDPPADLYRRGFYGQPIPGRDPGEALQLSLVEAAYLSGEGVLALDRVVSDPPVRDLPLVPPADEGTGGEVGDGDYGAVVARGRAVEGERFDRRLRVYAALRDSGVVPKTGFKFGADFRTYAELETVENLGHSELLVRVLSADTRVTPRDLSLDVRLAHGVRKQIVFALVDAEGVEWRSASRLTP